MEVVTQSNIVVRDGIAYLSIDDPELQEAIVDATSFKLEGSDYLPGRNRDKRTKLVRNNKCPVGLLDRVCRTMIARQVEPHITYADTQRAPKPRVAMRLFDVKPRRYQVEAELAAMIEDRGIFRVPTGGGKTLIAAQVIAAKAMCGLIVVPTIDLLRQTRDYLINHLAQAADPPGWLRAEDHLFDPAQWKIGQLGDGVVDPQPVTVATIRTIAKVLNVAYETYEFAEYDDSDDTEVNPKALREWVEFIGTVVVDEAHQLGAKVLYETVTRIPAPNKYGMSASPWRDDGADLMIEAATGPVIYRAAPERLVIEGFLMAPEIHVINTGSWWTSGAWGSVCAMCNRQRVQWGKACVCGCSKFRSQFSEAYRKEIVENPVRNANIAQIVQMLDRSTLVLVKLVKHGRLLADLIPGSLFLSGKDTGTKRQQVFDNVRAGRQQVVICTAIADMGMDLPSLSALVLAGGGKALALDTPIPTPTGWTTMGEIKAGDFVIDEQGKPTLVTRAHFAQYNRRCYRVRFSDGTSIVADGGHLWETSTRKSAGKTRVCTTDVIRDTLEAYRPGNWNHTIPVAQPIEGRSTTLQLDPYLLGVWLGDGDGRMKIHTNKSEVGHFKACFEDRGWETQTVAESSSGAAGQSDQAIALSVSGLRPFIRTLGLLIDKRNPQRTYVVKQIPQPYLRASVEQRLDLLRGLMDTDGHITKDGKAEWVTKSEMLADDVIELLRSLGYKPNVTTKHLKASGNAKKYGVKAVYGPYYTVRFYPTTAMMPVTLPHKVSRVRPSKKGRRINRQIVAVEPVDSVTVKCIEVDSLSHLYLAGEGMIPTHNSSTRHLQRIGRVVRIAEGKPTPLVIDFNDGHIHTWFVRHAQERRKIEHAEWGDLATWKEN